MDIHFTVAILVQQVCAPAVWHMKLLNCILLYVARAVCYGLIYSCSVHLSLHSFQAHVEFDCCRYCETRKLELSGHISDNGGIKSH